MLEEEGWAIKLDIRGQSCGLTDLQECHSKKITFIYGNTFYPSLILSRAGCIQHERYIFRLNDKEGGRGVDCREQKDHYSGRKYSETNQAESR